MASYREQLQQAVERTDKWKLSCLSSALMGDWAHHPKEHGFTLQCDPESWAKASRAMPHPPEIRANACAPVHLGAVTQLMIEGLQWAPVITVGDVLIDAKPCFNVTRNGLRRYLREGPEATDSINFHVWLTFADLTIFDLTIIPWQLRQAGAPMDLSRPDGLALLGDPDELQPEYEHRPMLIGPEFLWATGSVYPVAKTVYARAEKAWAERGFVQRA